jgi:hypothetical protein
MPNMSVPRAARWERRDDRILLGRGVATGGPTAKKNRWDRLGYHTAAFTEYEGNTDATHGHLSGLIDGLAIAHDLADVYV